MTLTSVLYSFDDSQLEGHPEEDTHVQLLQTVQEIREEIDVTSTSLLELSTHDLSRIDPPADTSIAFSANTTDSKLIDHLDLLFHADRSTTLSVELKETWIDYKRRPCRDTIYPHMYDFRSPIAR